MGIISLEVHEFLNHVCFNSTTYEEMYKYIYRRTGFDKFALSMFQTTIETWIDNLVHKEAENLDFFETLDRERIFDKLKKKHKLLDTQLDCINSILQKGVDANIDYHPTIRLLSIEDRNRVSTILDYTNPLLNGVGVMDGNDYIGEILDDGKMIQGAKIIQQFYEKYKDFQFDAMVLESPYHNKSGDRLYYFSRLFELYTERVKFILELIQCEVEVRHTVTIEPNRCSDKKNKIKSLKELFSNTEDYKKHMEALTTCEPALCEYDDNQNSYRFIGNEKTDRGCIGQYFNDLKTKGRISRDISRGDLAKILSSDIKNYSISEATITNTSNNYERIYRKQLSTII